MCIRDREGEEAQDSGEDRQGRPEDAEGIAEGQPDPAATIVHDPRQQHRDQCGPQDGRRLCQARERLDARDVLGEHGVDRDRRPDAEAAEHLGGHEGGEGAPLHLDEGGRRSDHPPSLPGGADMPRSRCLLYTSRCV